MVQMELGQPAAAKQNLIRVLQLDPRDAWAYLVLGNLYYKHEHDGGSAERYFATAADLAPDDSYVLNSYGGLLAERGRYAEAQEMFERAIAAQPDHPNPYLGLALVARKQGDEDAALAALERLFAQSGAGAAGATRAVRPSTPRPAAAMRPCAAAGPSAWPRQPRPSCRPRLTPTAPARGSPSVSQASPRSSPTPRLSWRGATGAPTM